MFSARFGGLFNGRLEMPANRFSSYMQGPNAPAIGDAATDTARMSFKAPNTSGTAWWFDFSYRMRS